VIFSINGGISSSTARSGIISRKCRRCARRRNHREKQERTWSSACASGPRRAAPAASLHARARSHQQRVADHLAQPLQRGRRRLRQPDPHRRAADIGFLQQRVERDQQVESSEFKFIRRIYIIFTIDWKNGGRKAMIGDQPIKGEAADERRRQQKLVQQIFADSAARSGRPSPTTSPRTQAGS
jgi:hypothetical protein